MDSPFLFGIEHELPCLREDGSFSDFSNTSFKELQSIINELPIFNEDYPKLRVGDLGIRHKRWYIECFERYDETGSLINCTPKKIEIRTTPRRTIQGAIDELYDNYVKLRVVMLQHNFKPTWISFNPFLTHFEPNPPLNEYEKKYRQSTPEMRSSTLPMITFGPDLNISDREMTDDEVIDTGKKLTYYSPFIVPFSFSSPFYDGRLWDGYSVRTYFRTGLRPAVRVFIKDKNKVIKSDPTLTVLNRTEFEAGRIEFKAIDVCQDVKIYAALLALLKGLVLDKTLLERRTTPDMKLHKISALEAFNNDTILQGSRNILKAARLALNGDADQIYLQLLEEMLEHKTVPAHLIRETYLKEKSINKTLSHYEGLIL